MIEDLRKQIESDLESVKTLEDVQKIKAHYLSKKGPIQALMLSLRDIAAEERPRMGKEINDLNTFVRERLASLENRLFAEQEEARLLEETLDITLPGHRGRLGRMHPITLMMGEVLEIHRELGFSIQYGPEVESDFYNFEALNFPADHPARDMHDTFYIAPGVLLRTHTSNTQIHVMEKTIPPIRIAAPGRCFRNEDITPRSHVFFHQVEGLYIHQNVSFADLMSTLDHLMRRIFSSDIELRFRPSYFPFVEPGLELDVSCSSCKGSGCHLCKGSGWLEVLGAGMVHPEVLKSGGVDPEEYTGYAWGLGIERLAMLRYGISDIRLFAENDLRFLNQF